MAQEQMCEVVFHCMQLLEDRDQPVMFMRVVDTLEIIPVWVNYSAASHLLNATSSEEDNDLSAHRLFASFLNERYESLEGRITGWHNGVFDTKLRVDGQDYPARLTDVLALSYLMDFPVLCKRELIAQLTVKASDHQEDVVEEFKSFLDNIEADDFDQKNP